jgi:ribulose-phosphate 3-epimerase
MPEVTIGASILTADFTRLGEEIAIAESAGVDYFHLDIMDGRYVPNITFGPLLVQSVRRITALPIDVHLMIVEPERYIASFIEFGANSISVHVETAIHLNALLAEIRRQGASAGVTLNPGTPLVAIEEVVPLVDQVLVMSVNPGFGGQTFIPASLAKISRLRQMVDSQGFSCRIQVDGGLKASNVARVVNAGADSLIVGSGIYNPHESVLEAVEGLRKAIELERTTIQ